MKALKIGYILSLSFLLVLTVVTATFGFYPAPKGPKAPEYPKTASYDYTSDSYKNQTTQYEAQRTQYDAEQKFFLQNQIVAYTRNVVVLWIFSLIVFGIVGLLLSLVKTEVVGAGYVFSGVWAVLYGPVGLMMWYVSGLVRTFGARAEQDFSTDSIFQSAAYICIFGVIVLTALGIVIFRRKSPQPQAVVTS